LSKNSAPGVVLLATAFAIGAAVLAASGQAGWQALVFCQAIFDGEGGIVDGLEEASAVAISPDGNHVYVAGWADDAVAVFSRNSTTGNLTWVEVERDGVIGVDGLDGALSAAVSPDGSHVYVAGAIDNAVAVFSRNASTGGLTWVEVEKDGVGSVDGLDGAFSVAVSPDGKHVYVAGASDNGVAVFSRNASTGGLTWVEVEKDGVGEVDGLAEAASVTVSPDGNHVYVAGWADDAVAVFSRNATTGSLTWVEVKTDGVGGVDGLAGAHSVAVSPDGNYVYVAGYGDDAVAVFSRNATTGSLTWVEVKREGVGGVDGLSQADSVVVSPDGLLVCATGGADDAVAVFTRNPSRGTLTYSETVKDGGDGVDGLDGAAGLAVSPNGDHVYVAGAVDSSVAIFESRGPEPREEPPAFTMTWGSNGSGPAEFELPQGLAAGSVYVVDTGNSRIQKFNATGNFILEWGSVGTANGSFQLPRDVAVDSSGYVYVADQENHRIQVFEPDGTFWDKWGSLGMDPGYFQGPLSVDVDADSYVYVVDEDNYRIQKFHSSGTFAATWGSYGTGPGQFVDPSGIGVAANGDCYVSEGSQFAPAWHRIQRFDSNGTLLASWGAGPSAGNGRFNRPGKSVVDAEGNVYVPDRVNNRIQKFDRDGNFLVAWGTPGSGDGQLNVPSAVAVDALGRIYVADMWNHRIQVFSGPYLEYFIGDAPRPGKTLWLEPPSAP
jgi:DNA-binding beta-propeller fold protein YncE